MLTKEQIEEARIRAAQYLDRAGIVVKPEEAANIEIADFGLGQPEQSGLEIVVYVNTSRVCAKEIVLFPHQTCPEHRHPRVEGEPGKEETFRCRWGKVYLCIPGDPTPNPAAKPPADHEACYTVWHEIVLNPGDQYTLPPNTLHWFQAGPEGAILSEFSTKSRDDADVFTDPEIQRVPDR
ncbi:MAG TPA: D-lyxose/D-mannose family sugar isomerase [Armatimonadota bacterium]|nr:D-lyxose/D-mannose family sugar isomerase [Armatimonadota bacterium]